MRSRQRNALRELLEEDRFWCAYALADLEPDQDEHCLWVPGRRALALVYRGLQPPTLFSHGDPRELNRLLEQVPPGRYVYTLLGSHRAIMENRLRVESETKMWRMVYQGKQVPAPPPANVRRLTPEDLPAIEALFAEHPDRPDAFHERQLQAGPFYGYWTGSRLASVAGVHVRSDWADVAALGNVFTDPGERGKGYGTLVSAAVLRDLLFSNTGTIVLNVAMDNGAALRSYRKLGFWPYCGYLEGVARLYPEARR